MNFNDFWYWLSNGTGAEWISSIGALVAIVFAYWQIYEQRKEYENDRREEKVEKRLSNRPFFTVIQKNIIQEEKEVVWVNTDDAGYLFLYSKNINKTQISFFKGYLYEFRSVTPNIALGIVLQINYYDNNKKLKYSDTICTCTPVVDKEKILFSPHNVFASYDEVVNMSKDICLFYKSIDGIYYREVWREEVTNQNVGNNIQPNASILKFMEIKEVDSADVPQQNQAIGCLVNHKNKIYASKK